jgi:F0F1-type ATP synthase membrane subunit b/b'
MGLLDRVKASAEVAFEKAKDAAEQGIEKAKEEAKELQLKRELGKTREDLGRRVVDLVNAGAISHPDLIGGVARANDIQKQIDELSAPASHDDEGSGGDTVENPS